MNIRAKPQPDVSDQARSRLAAKLPSVDPTLQVRGGRQGNWDHPRVQSLPICCLSMTMDSCIMHNGLVGGCLIKDCDGLPSSLELVSQIGLPLVTMALGTIDEKKRADTIRSRY